MRTDLTRRVVLLAGSLTLLVAVAVASVCVGAQPIAPGEVLRAFTDHSGSAEHLIVRDVRGPRTVLGLCVGAALGTAGALVQTLTRNPLAEPGILGVTGGAAFAITIGASVGLAGSQAAQLLLALAGAVLSALIVYAVGRTAPLRLVLAGTALTSLLAGVSLGLRLLQPDVFDEFRFWYVGSLAGREQTPFLLPLVLLLLALAGAMAATRPLNALALGEQVAATLGARVRRVRVAVLALITVLAATATAVAGPIAFVGLIVPHLARRLASGSIPWLMAYTMVLSPVLLVAADVISRVLLPTGEVPVAIVTAFLGGPALIWAVRRYGTVAL
ncbi:iron complex transport system permease protein [Actinocorallia herbida]|uniref:Iron complex transport system permease protein n=1 Tax=Actinocorallia herbida TaxID=58109 RepID=A0A3N1CXZ7_9ACTN|nr:iron chelate uptake ABC transporter family permease subunit [Actinocorallia herbida]ROO86173.1 iron complex transport system permease protein [Actinocorallia herbida]